MLQGIAPEVPEVPALAETLVELLPPILEVVLERPALPCQTEQHIARVHGVGEDGLHHRLLQRVDPGARARVAPLLERMQIREHEIRRGGGLVQIR